MTRPTFLNVDANALRHNMACVKSSIKNSEIVAMVKANAYGHGLTWTAAELEGHVDYLGVACLDEAVALQKNGIKTRCLLVEGVYNADEMRLAHHTGCSMVLHQIEQLDLLKQLVPTQPQDIWVKINTGMNRLGFHPQQFQYVIDALSQLSFVNQPITVMTHFSDADEVLSPITERQIKLFNEITKGVSVRKSLANSAGIIQWPTSHEDVVRPGIMLYGVSPFANVAGEHHGLIPVMSLHSKLIAVRSCQRGDKIGYGGEYTCPEAMPVGIVAIGYGDGYPHHAINGTPVLVNGHRVPLVGSVSMDMLCVDLRSQPFSKIGDPVLLWGPGLPVEEIAAHSGTIPYELLCHMTARVPRQNSVLNLARVK